MTCVIETKFNGEWTTDGIGNNEPRSRGECEDDIQALKKLGGTWATACYRIVD